MFHKITTGFVVQRFEDDGTPIDQEFVAGDECEFENPDGSDKDLNEEITNKAYLPYEMKSWKELLEEGLANIVE